MSHPAATPPTRGVLVQYLLLALTWGSSFLLVEVGLRALSAPQVVGARLVVGAAVLWLIVAARRMAVPRDRRLWGHLAVVSILLCVLPFLLFAWAQRDLSSGLASIYNATTPLMTTAVAVAALPAERLTRTRAAGLLLGFAGVLVVLAPWRSDLGGDVLAQLACLCATASYGVAFVYLKRYVSPYQVSAVPLAALQVSSGAALMLLVTPFLAGGVGDVGWLVAVSMLALGGLGTGLAYVWNNNVVAGWGATRASTVTYLTPVVGVALGALLLGETLTWNQPLGAAVVVLGIALGQGRLTGRAGRTAARSSVTRRDRRRAELESR